MEMPKCAECGFLTIHGNATEVDWDLRHKWPDVLNAPEPRRPLPSCYEEAFQLKDEIGAWGDCLQVISRPRECSQFTKWLPHKSPEEHRKMSQEREHNTREERNLQFQREREERSYHFQEKQLAFQKEDKESDRKHREKLETRSKLWAVGTAVLIVFLTGFSTWLIQQVKDHTPPAPIEVKPIINNIMPSLEKPKEKP
jgi:hypothetical protein